jgi:hypothetical protein
MVELIAFFIFQTVQIFNDGELIKLLLRLNGKAVSTDPLTAFPSG